MQRWDGPFDRHKPNGEPFDPNDVPMGLPGDRSMSSEWELWIYIGKGLLILMACAFLLTNALYGFFELLAFLAD